ERGGDDLVEIVERPGQLDLGDDGRVPAERPDGLHVLTGSDERGGYVVNAQTLAQLEVGHVLGRDVRRGEIGVGQGDALVVGEDAGRDHPGLEASTRRVDHLELDETVRQDHAVTRHHIVAETLVADGDPTGVTLPLAGDQFDRGTALQIDLTGQEDADPDLRSLDVLKHRHRTSRPGRRLPYPADQLGVRLLVPV